MTTSSNSFKSIVLSAAMILVCNTLVSQSVSTWEKTPDDKRELRKFKNNYFHAVSGVPGTGLRFIYYNSETYIQYISFGMLGLSYEARYNLFNHRDWLSASISAAPYFDLTMDNDSWSRGIQLGVDLNLWNHSTFNNLSSKGLAFSTGFQINKFSDEPFSGNPFLRVTYKYTRYKDILDPDEGWIPGKTVNKFVAIQTGFSSNGIEVGLPFYNIYECKIIFGRILNY